MELFLSKNEHLTLGVVLNETGEDKEIINKIKKGYDKRLFELAIEGSNHENYLNLTRQEQMVLLFKSSEKLSDLFSAKTNLLIPPHGLFNNSTLEAMNQVGMRVISGKINYKINSDKILPIVSNVSVRANYTKIYNIPWTVGLSEGNMSGISHSTEQIMQEITASIEKYGYAVIAIYPDDFLNLLKKHQIQNGNITQLKKLSSLIDQIHSHRLSITNFESITGINNSKFYEPRVPKPVIRDVNLKVEQVYDGFNFPTKMAFLGKNDILVLEKNDGIVKRITNGTFRSNVLDLDVSSKGERGLLGVAVANGSGGHQYVYLYYSKSLHDGLDNINKNEMDVENVLYRYELINGKLVHAKLLLSLPKKSTWAHNGGAMTIGPDNNLYIVVGDQVISDTKAQNIQSGPNPQGNGGILRISLNGHRVGAGILGSILPLDLYYAYGIRNSIGIAFDPVRNNLWDTENGENSGDEINLVKPGFNSGWKKIQGLNQTESKRTQDVPDNNNSDLVDFGGIGSYSEPELTWTFSSGPTGVTFFNGNSLGAKYHNNIFVGDFHNGYLYNFNLTSNREHLVLDRSTNSKYLKKSDVDSFVLAKGFGGIVDIKEGPDGYLYVLSTHAGDANCLTLAKHCIPYESPVGGTLFRIRPVQPQP